MGAFIYGGCFVAPKDGSTSRKPKGKPNSFGGYTFLTVSLSSEDKEWLATADCALEFPIQGLLDLVQEGYKVSFNYDGKNHTHIATLTDNSPESPTHKSILSGRGSSTLNAWFALMYRHNILLQKDWSSAAHQTERSDFD